MTQLPLATKAYQSLVRVNPRSHRGYSQLGVILSTWSPGHRPDLDAARKAFARSLELDPEESGSYLRLGILELRAGYLKEALGHFNKASGSASPAGIFWAGYVYFLQGRLREAGEHFTKVVETAEFEQRLASRGARSEGDTKRHPEAGAKPQPAPTHEGDRPHWTPLQEAWVLASFFLSNREVGMAFRAEESAKGRQALLLTEAKPLGHRTGALTPVLEIRPASLPSRVAWADLDRDGSLELLYSKGHEVITSFMQTDPAIDFQPVIRDISSEIVEAIWGDLDGDRLPDCLLYTALSPDLTELRRFRNRTSEPGRVLLEEQPIPADLQEPRTVVTALLADLDGDGRVDLVEGIASSQGQPAVRVYLNRDYGFQRQPLEGTIPSGITVRLLSADFDGDNQLEVMALRWNRPPIVLWNKGAGRLIPATLPFDTGESVCAVPLDFEDDGRMDLLIGRRSGFAQAIAGMVSGEPAPRGQSLLWLKNEGGQQFRDVSESKAGGLGFGVLDLAVTDVDGDQKPDVLIVTGDIGPGLSRLEPGRILLNTGTGDFRASCFLPAAASTWPSARISIAPSPGKGNELIFIPGSGLFASGSPQFPSASGK